MRRFSWTTLTLATLALVGLLWSAGQTETVRTFLVTGQSGNATLGQAILESFTKAQLDALGAGTAGRCARVTDDVRGIWCENGTRWLKVVPYVQTSDFGAHPSATAATNVTGIQAAWDAATASANYKKVLLDVAGTYDVNALLTKTSQNNFILEGLAGNGFSSVTTLRWTGAANGTMLSCLGCRWFEINNIQFNGNSTAGVGLQLRNTAAPAVWSDFDSHNLSFINFDGLPGVGLLLGEGDATPGFSGVRLWNFQAWDGVEGIRINNGGGQSIALYQPTIAGNTHGIHFVNGGFVDVYDGNFANNTNHYNMVLGNLLNLHGGYYEAGRLINWGNHNAYSININGILSTEATAEVITYGGGTVVLNSRGNRWARGITLAAAGNQAIKLHVEGDTFVTGGWVNNANTNTFIVDGRNVTDGLYGSATFDPGSLVDGAGTTSANITVTGAVFGDMAEVAAPYSLLGVTVTAYVSQADVVVIRVQNESGLTFAPGSGTWKVRVRKTP